MFWYSMLTNYFVIQICFGIRCYFMNPNPPELSARGRFIKKLAVKMRKFPSPSHNLSAMTMAENCSHNTSVNQVLDVQIPLPLYKTLAQ